MNTGARVVAQVGLGFEFAGVVVLAWVSGILLRASGGWGGGISGTVVRSVKWRARFGWALILLGVVAQSVALWLA